MMAFLSENWFYMLLLAAFVAMHLLGSGCGRSHSRSRRRLERESSPAGAENISSARVRPTTSVTDTPSAATAARTTSRRDT